VFNWLNIGITTITTTTIGTITTIIITITGGITIITTTITGAVIITTITTITTIITAVGRIDNLRGFAARAISGGRKFRTPPFPPQPAGAFPLVISAS
jgi:hypothetical protein